MRVLVYKRTHNGDPDASGCFGVYDCMGIVRDREYDAIIGVGGVGPEAVSNGIDGQVNWVGIGPHKRYVKDKRGPEVLFEHFLYFGTDGPDFHKLAPQLAARMYGDNVRSILDGMSDAEQEEAERIVALAEDEPPSPGLGAAKQGGSAADVCRFEPLHLTRPRALFCTAPRDVAGQVNLVVRH